MSINNYKAVLPQDLNHYGYIFGGNLLKWVDEYSWIAAALEFPDCNLVTSGMEKVQFRKSVKQGSILRFHIKNIKQGIAYVKFKVNVFCKNSKSLDEEIIFDTIVTFVNIGDNGKASPLPKTVKNQ